ncbi:TonB-dependent receptor [Flavobacterium amniphilum]|uniref:outer membrane beta-barrel family protein n=1 Tax=Flavobacterium amniphilum TaxID=1834035 RepID=UPI002029FD9A|nr:outer membrane beta-barrel family protein [Flavobacterium amniphilum]MCL9804255.1 TonB-dependent receptor [Flavobacterium amniphilum]
MKNTFALLVTLLISAFCAAQNEIEQDTVTKKLEEIEIKGKEKVFKNKSGITKIDVANSVFKSANNVVDLLSRLPNVQISPDKESVTVVGKGNPLLYIDNQKASMNDFNALSVDDIKSIEILKNPDSKYEAEGKVVIRIIRKWSKTDQFKVGVSETMSFKKRFNNYFGISSSFKKKRLELKTNFNYNALNIWERHDMSYQIPEATISSNYDVEAYTKRPQFIIGGGLFYKINDDDYFSFNANAKLQKDIFGINTKTLNIENQSETKNVTASDNDDTRNFINSYVNYSKKIKFIDAHFFTGIQYSNFSKNMNTIVQNNENNSQFIVTQNRRQEFDVSVFSARTDFEKVFKNEMKLEMGTVFLDADAETRLNVIDYVNSEQNSSDYSFNEMNISGYSQLSGKAKKIEYYVGLRIENTDIKGKYDDSTLAVKKNYTHFFPKLEISVSIDSSKSLILNYSKSIARPNYSKTNQGTTYINPYFIYSSNINLNPAISNEIGAGFQWKDKSVNVIYYNISDPVYANFSYNDQSNILTYNEKNFNQASGVNVDFTLPFTYKIWTMNNNLSFVLNKIKDEQAVQNESKPYLYYYSNNMFTLPKKYTISITAWGMTNQKEGVFRINQPRFLMDVAISKTFSENWECTLNFNDIFRSSIYQQNFTINNISSRANYFMDAREIAFGVKYSFGKITKSEFREKVIDENANRIK